MDYLKMLERSTVNLNSGMDFMGAQARMKDE
jgi:hypothetical protein